MPAQKETKGRRVTAPADESDDDEGLMNPFARFFQVEGTTLTTQQRKVEKLNDGVSEDIRELRDHFADMNLSTKSFNVLDVLGTGTFGQVRLVSMNVEGKTHFFALKIMQKANIIHLKQVPHIKSEKNLLMEVSHPFIVNILTAFQDDINLYMLLEYVLGGEVFTLLRRANRFTSNTARFYAAEIVLAFGYLHSKGIVYRDLKPENLLIDSEGHIKITDFGFAKKVKGRTYTVCGTPEYLAPEILLSKGHGEAVDWWALGILIFEMLAGYAPFYDDSHYVIYKKILKGKFAYPRRMDRAAKDLIGKLLTADLSKRYGCLRGGVEDIKNHSWFKRAGTNWTEIMRKRVPPPFVPTYKSPDDTSNFPSYPDEQPSSNYKLTAHDQSLFVDF